MLTYATGDPEPLRAPVNAAVDYVRAFMTHARKSRSAPPRRRARPEPRDVTTPLDRLGHVAHNNWVS